MTSMTKAQKQERKAESIDRLINHFGITPGARVYTSHHGANGTNLKLYVVQNGEIRNITWHVCNVLGKTPKDKDGEWFFHNPVYGMDRGFDVVYQLASVLFRDMDPEEIKQNSSNHGSTDPGYLLDQSWL